MGVRAGIAVWFVAVALVAAPALAQSPDDSQIKARVALAIARFAEIPDQRQPGPLQLCLAVHGTPPKPLLALAGEKVGAHGVVVQVGPPFAACDVIYLHESYSEWRRLLEEPRAPALTVGDVQGFLAAGGMVELVIDSDAVRFDVNLRALRLHRIRLPAQVLKLARQVRD
jgi:hypothetical protein